MPPTVTYFPMARGAPVARRRGDVAMVELLLERGASASAEAADGTTALALCRQHGELPHARACARDPPCAADAKNQCEAQMKYRMGRKEMRRPHQAVLPRMPVMPTVRGTTNQPVDVL